MMQETFSINGIEVHARYTEEERDRIFRPLLERLTKMQKKCGRRIVVLVAAPPGAGKTTLLAYLSKLSREDDRFTPICALGIDGYHRLHKDLCATMTVRDGKTIPMSEIKGAPETFDPDRLYTDLLAYTRGKDVPWPVYDRILGDPVPHAATATGPILLLEGNYLLLDSDEWEHVRSLADYTVRIDADDDILRPRLLARKCKAGFDPAYVADFVERSDLYNARNVREHSAEADLSLLLLPDDTYVQVTPFERKVWMFLRTIPKKHVVTYGTIARAIGCPKASRAVGNALHKNPDPDHFPCFRGVDREGRLAAHFGCGGIDGQRSRLISDGIAVMTDNTVDLKEYGYVPVLESVRSIHTKGDVI